MTAVTWHASICFRMGSKFRCIGSIPTELQPINENDLECLAIPGVNRPETMFPKNARNSEHPRMLDCPRGG